MPTQIHHRLALRERQAQVNLLPLERQAQIINALIEGCSIRAAARLVGVEHKTVMRVLLRAGQRSAELHDEKIRRLRAQRVQVDEIWTYVFEKQARLNGDDNHAEMGDQYVFTGMDGDCKLIISLLAGKCDARTAFYLIQDLRDRLASRVQLTKAGFRPYLSAVEDTFGIDIDHAMMLKMYGSERRERAPERYAPARVVAALASCFHRHTHIYIKNDV